MMITCVDENLQPVLSLPLACKHSTNHPFIISKQQCPWHDDGYLVDSTNYYSFTLTSQSLNHGSDIINNDPCLLHYLGLSNFDLDKFSSPTDEYGYRSIKI